MWPAINPGPRSQEIIFFLPPFPEQILSLFGCHPSHFISPLTNSIMWPKNGASNSWMKEAHQGSEFNHYWPLPEHRLYNVKWDKWIFDQLEKGIDWDKKSGDNLTNIIGKGEDGRCHHGFH
jgi:hypothetical protein